MKRKNKKENFKFRNVLLLIIGLIVINSIFSANKSYSNTDLEYKIEYASSGDTLWTIAQKESKNNKYYQDKDVREIVYELKKINNMQSSDLNIGQEIKIPKI